MLKIIQSARKLYYGWVVVLAFSIIGTTLVGIRFSFGIFFKSIQGEFDITRAETSSVLSVYMVLGTIFVVLGGWVLDKYGPRIVVLSMGIVTGIGLLLSSQIDSLWQLYITYSLLLAMGTSVTYLVIISTISRWFDTKRGMALGIATLGAGFGPLVIAPLATYIISNFSWRMAYLVIGIIVWLLVIPLSRLLKKGPHEIEIIHDGKLSRPTTMYSSQDVNDKTAVLSLTDISLSRAFRTRSLWFFISIYLLFSMSHLFYITHIVPHITDIGFSPVEAATVISLIGIGGIAGRIIIGVLSDKIGNKLSVIICTLILSGAIACALWSRELWMFYLVAVVYGFAHGGRGPTIGSLVGDTFGLSKMGSILGVIEVGFNIGAAVGPAIGGVLYDIEGSYSLAFSLATTAILISAILTALVRKENH
ncbi:MFS transporter [Chloroflexota bacterium]